MKGLCHIPPDLRLDFLEGFLTWHFISELIGAGISCLAAENKKTIHSFIASADSYWASTMFPGRCWPYTADSPWLHQIKTTNGALLEAYPPQHWSPKNDISLLPHAILRHPKPCLSNPVYLWEPFPLSICPMKAPDSYVRSCLPQVGFPWSCWAGFLHHLSEHTHKP